MAGCWAQVALRLVLAFWWAWPIPEAAGCGAGALGLVVARWWVRRVPAWLAVWPRDPRTVASLLVVAPRSWGRWSYGQGGLGLVTACWWVGLAPGAAGCTAPAVAADGSGESRVAG